MLHHMKKHIPNTITCCNLISGCIATLYASQANYSMALTFIIIGAVFDFFDGFAARLLHVSSPVGKELDSLADDITFGFAPATIVYSMLKTTLSSSTCGIEACPLITLLPYAAFIIAAFSALRLAKFNLDERQATSFIGLPTPANALFWGALSLTLSTHGWLVPNTTLAICLLVGILLSSWLLVAEIPMFALKFKSYGWKDNELRFSFIILSAILLVILKWGGFSLIIVLYILTSILSNAFGTKVAHKE